MSKILLSYDLKASSESQHGELKKMLIDDYAFFDEIKGKSKLVQLPTTTLIKRDTSLAQATAHFKNACEKLSIEWHSFIVVEYSEATFNSHDD
ncbi:MAG TPA: hypothetical protein VIM65_04315 [Cyclobacteriaceae bacterium]